MVSRICYIYKHFCDIETVLCRIVVWSKFHRSLFLRVQLAISQDLGKKPLRKTMILARCGGTLTPWPWHDDGMASWWRHQMETFSALLALCAGNSRPPVNSPHKGQWRGVLVFSLICVWINNREADDLKRHRGHYDVTVMMQTLSASLALCEGNHPYVRGIHPTGIWFFHKGTVIRGFGVFFVISLNSLLSKQSNRWWLRRHNLNMISL